MTEKAAPAPNPTPPPPPPLARNEAPGTAPKNRSLGKPFTAKQQAVWDLTRPLVEGGRGKTRAEAAVILGISAPVVSKTLQACYRKKGLSGKGGLNAMSGVEFKNPGKAAAIVDALSDPLLKVKEALVASGLPDKVSNAVLHRLRVKFFGVVHEVKALKTQEIVRTIEEKLDMIRFYLDDKVMAEASARDLMLGMGVLVEKRALLRGEPTQIISDHERAKIHELVPALLAEAQRRGLTVDGLVLEKKLEPLGSPA